MASALTGSELRELLATHGLTRARAAEMVCATKAQFDKWCLPEDSSNYHPMPPAAVKLLRILLGLEPVAQIKPKKAAHGKTARIVRLIR